MCFVIYIFKIKNCLILIHIHNKISSFLNYSFALAWFPSSLMADSQNPTSIPMNLTFSHSSLAINSSNHNPPFISINVVA